MYMCCIRVQSEMCRDIVIHGRYLVRNDGIDFLVRKLLGYLYWSIIVYGPRYESGMTLLVHPPAHNTATGLKSLSRVRIQKRNTCHYPLTIERIGFDGTVWVEKRIPTP